MNNKIDNLSRKRRLREKVDLLLPDGLMFMLAIVMVVVMGLRYFGYLSKSNVTFLQFIDYSILAVFIIEYFLKAALADDLKRHVLNPWHILDLIIILTPFLDFVPSPFGIRNSTPALRLLRILRLVAVGSRAVDRKLADKPVNLEVKPEKRQILIRIVENDLTSGFRDVSMPELAGYIRNMNPTWVDILNVEKEDLDQLSSAISVTKYFLEAELFEESYPHIGRFENRHLIYARIPDCQAAQGTGSRGSLSGQSVLIICSENNLITIAHDPSDFCEKIVRKSYDNNIPGRPFLVSALYTILKSILDLEEQLIKNLEQKLLKLESIPIKDLPADFLEKTFFLRKEVSHLVPSLGHMKEVLKDISSNRISLTDFNDKYMDIFRTLSDRAAYLQETAATVKEGINSLRDLHINTTSYEMNRVMRLIAVISCMTVIPTMVGGLLGMNLIGANWPMELWHVIAFVIIVMLGLGWIFYRLGWLKR